MSGGPGRDRGPRAGKTRQRVPGLRQADQRHRRGRRRRVLRCQRSDVGRDCWVGELGINTGRTVRARASSAPPLTRPTRSPVWPGERAAAVAVAGVTSRGDRAEHRRSAGIPRPRQSTPSQSGVVDREQSGRQPGAAVMWARSWRGPPVAADYERAAHGREVPAPTSTTTALPSRTRRAPAASASRRRRPRGRDCFERVVCGHRRPRRRCGQAALGRGGGWRRGRSARHDAAGR